MKMAKRISSFLLALIMVLSMLPANHAHAAGDATVWNGTDTATAFAGGSGTSASPYQIATAAQLNYLAQLLKTNSSYSTNWTNYGTKYYKLTADLDMADYPFSGIKWFNGSFDGNGHTISGLNISSENSGTDDGNNGLFGIFEGVAIKNLTTAGNIHSDQMSGGIVAQIRKGTVSNCVNYCTVYSGYRAGGIVGYVWPTGSITISNCKNYGMVTGDSIGGIIGRIQEENSTLTNYTTVKNCANIATVQGSSYVGGIAGWCEGGSIQYCANTGNVSCISGSYAGGIVGEISSNGNAGYYAKATIQNCYNTGAVTSVKEAAGIAPRVYGHYGFDQTVKTTLKSCYNVGTVNGSTASYHVGPVANDLVTTGNLYYLSTINSSAKATTATPLNATQMTQKASFSGFSFSSSAWSISATASYTYPYISAIGQLPTACPHYWKDATCMVAQTCTCCGLTQGSLGDHKYEDGVCTLCGKNQYHEHDGLIYTDWTSDSELPSQAGRYCLTNNVTLTQAWTAPAGELVLCLNGMSIIGSYTKTVENGSTLTLCDCASSPGAIIGRSHKNLTNIAVNAGGVLNVSDINITAETAQSWNDEYSSSVVAISNQGIFNLHSGNILANTNAFVYRGASTTGINNTGTFNMHGGTVRAYAESHSSDGHYYATGIDNTGAGVTKIFGGQILAELGTSNTQKNKKAHPLEIYSDVYLAGIPTVSGLNLLGKAGAVHAKIGSVNYNGGVIEFWDRYNVLAVNRSIVVRDVTENVNDTKFTLTNSLSQPMSLILVGSNLLYDSGEVHTHTWTGSCGTVRVCSVCEYTDGVIVEHVWLDATCTTPKTCSVCGATEGSVAGHDPEDLVFTAEGKTITGTCGSCNGDMGSLTLSTPDQNYDPDSVYTATVTGQISGLDSYELTYCCPDGCKEPGPHTATLKIGSVTVDSYFHINSTQLTVVAVKAEDRVYDGSDWINVTEVTLQGVPEGADVQVDLSQVFGYLYTYGAGIKTTLTLDNVKLIGADAASYTIDSRFDNVPITDGVTITPLALTLKANDRNVLIGTQVDLDPLANFNITGGNLGWSDAVNWVDITGDTSKVTDSGVLTISNAQIINNMMEDVTSSYTITYLPGVLTVYCNDHDWTPANCTAPKTCSLCGITEGENIPDAHDYVGTVCRHCGRIGGKWGDQHHWTFDAQSGKLIISGTGDMPSLAGLSAPWEAYSNDITSLEVEAGVTSVGEQAFFMLTNLQSAVLPEGLEYIYDHGFSSCYSLKNLTLPQSLLYIGECAFWSCPNYTDIVVPNKVAFVGDRAFWCEDDGNIRFLCDAPQFGADAFENVTGVACYPVNNPTWTEEVRQNYGGEITWVADSCVEGHNWVDADCDTAKTCSACGATEGEALGHNWIDANCINPKTCSACGTTEGSIAEGKHSFVNGACEHCGIPGGYCGDPAVNGGKNVMWTLVGDKLIISGSGDMANFNPDAPWCDYSDSIAEVVIENGITTIGDHAFRDCTVMTGITIPHGVVSIGNGAFVNCFLLSDITIPDSVTTIGDSAFAYCIGLTRVTIPDIVTSLGACAFFNCNNVEELVLSNNLTAIEERTFSWFEHLLQVEIPDSVETIGIAAFEGCTLLNHVVIADSVVTIEEDAFSHCASLNEVIFCGTETQWNGINMDTGNDALKNAKLQYHDYPDAGCTDLRTCNICGETETEPQGHAWLTADCDTPKTCSVCGATDGEPLGHDWEAADCDTPKTCSSCGETEGEALGHNWVDADCDTAKTCSACGATDGEPLGHNWVAADCDTAKTCSVCGDTEGDPLGHNWMAYTCTAPETCSICGETRGEAFGHVWVDADCDTPKSCSACDATEGDPLGHSWVDANCDTAKTCSACGTTDGEPLGHSWVDANCTTPKICSHCGATATGSEALGHSWVAADCDTAKTCSSCGATEGDPLGHSWVAADCDTAKTCSVCGATEGEALGHNWVDADCDTAKTCSVCGETDGDPLGHSWVAADCDTAKTCSACGATTGNALGHNWNPATCTENTFCIECGKVVYGTKLSHTEVTDPAVEATCTETGLTEGKHCSFCDKVLTARQEIPAKGHVEVAVPGKAATETETGLTEGKKCSVCDTITVPQEVIPVVGHVHVETKIPATVPTCTKTGLTEGKKCSACGAVTAAQETIPALGHDWADASCTTPKTCKTCGTTSGNASGHSWVGATCEDPKTCSVCRITSGNAVHTFDNNVDGTCNICGINRVDVESRKVVHMFRMYNPNTGEHFYTGSEVERDNLIGHGWHYEGIGFTFPANTGAPVYRLFHEPTGEHLYTMDVEEKDKLIAEGWNYEGVAFNSAYDTEAVQHRLHNPNATVGAYHFTFSVEEKQNLINAGWEYQGIGWYSCWK